MTAKLQENVVKLTVDNVDSILVAQIDDKYKVVQHIYMVDTIDLLDDKNVHSYELYKTLISLVHPNPINLTNNMAFDFETKNVNNFDKFVFVVANKFLTKPSYFVAIFQKNLDIDRHIDDKLLNNFTFSILKHIVDQYLKPNGIKVSAKLIRKINANI